MIYLLVFTQFRTENRFALFLELLQGSGCSGEGRFRCSSFMGRQAIPSGREMLQAAAIASISHSSAGKASALT